MTWGNRKISKSVQENVFDVPCGYNNMRFMKHTIIFGLQEGPDDHRIFVPHRQLRDCEG